MSEQRKDDGGPAFPVVTPGLVYSDGSYESASVHHQGLTVRDYFAIHFAEGLARHAAWSGEQHEQNDRLAKTAYVLADAMLAERSKP